MEKKDNFEIKDPEVLTPVANTPGDDNDSTGADTDQDLTEEDHDEDETGTQPGTSEDDSEDSGSGSSNVSHTQDPDQ